MNNRFSSFLLFLEALSTSFVVRIVLRFFKPAVRLRWMGQAVSMEYVLPDPSEEQLRLLRAIKISVTRCSRYAPWSMECYTQALTARKMLRRRKLPLLLSVGFKKEEGQSLQGHAWTWCGQYIVTGYRTDLKEFTVNGCFL
ncbi:MAG: lasso peptide biosynthesis B2 protein [Sphingomonadales bacterium]|nr:lasso peptide biosynthesis B2 protein [Sphingomonadales bacterium]